MFSHLQIQRRQPHAIAFAIACLFAGSLIAAQAAHAECSQKARALGKCPPVHADPMLHMQHKAVVPHAGPTPVEGASGAGVHGIIFVGGHVGGRDKAAINSQPVPPGHPASQVPLHNDTGALNPQPIPPGHPRPGKPQIPVPVKRIGH